MCLEETRYRSDLLEVVYQCAMGEGERFIRLYIAEEGEFNQRLLECLEGHDRAVSSLVGEMLSRLTEPQQSCRNEVLDIYFRRVLPRSI